MNIIRFPNIQNNVLVEKVLNELLNFGNKFKYLDDVVLKICSVNRTPPDQHFVISQQFLIAGYKSYGLFPEYDPRAPVDKKVWIPELNKEVYTWQRAWSRLLHSGMTIMPPLTCEALESFLFGVMNFANGTSLVMGERVVQQSFHCQGLAFDIKEDRGERKEILQLLNDAKKAGVPIRNWYPERNAFIHVNI